MRFLLISLAVVGASACGVGPGASPARTVSASQALTGAPEWLEFESVQTRVELFRDALRQPALFPMSRDGALVAAPVLDAKLDLLSGADAGAVLISFDTKGDRFQEDRRDAFQGLSEREATELIARALLAQWKLKPTGVVTVTRAAGAPYAAAWLDGTLRINPAFVYMAAAPSAPSTSTPSTSSAQ